MLLAATLALTLVLGVAVLVVGRAERAALRAREHPADPLTAQQATAQAVTAAVDIAAAADLQDPAGAYSVRSCTTGDGPPYRAVVNMTFLVPQGNPPRYLADVADVMTDLGWTTAATSAPHFGHKLVHDGLTATFFRNAERTDLATMTVDGACRVVDTEQPRDWVDVTARLRAAG